MIINIVLVPRTFEDAIEAAAGLRCPECGEVALLMYGCDWDYDRILCGRYGCAWEFKYETTTLPDDY